MNYNISAPVLNEGELYGAKRWVSILKRQCERLGCAMGISDYQYCESLNDMGEIFISFIYFFQNYLQNIYTIYIYNFFNFFLFLLYM